MKISQNNLKRHTPKSKRYCRSLARVLSRYPSRFQAVYNFDFPLGFPSTESRRRALPVLKPRSVSECYTKLHTHIEQLHSIAYSQLRSFIFTFSSTTIPSPKLQLCPSSPEESRHSRLTNTSRNSADYYFPEKVSKTSNWRFLPDSIFHSRLRLTVYSGRGTTSRSKCTRVVVDSGGAVFYPEGYKGDIGVKTL